MSVIDYTNNFSTSNFPFEVMNINKQFEDVTDNIAEHVNYVKELHRDKKYAEAAEYIVNPEHDLTKYILSAKDINFLDEETRNLEILCLSKRQSVFYMTDEPLFIDLTKGDVWIGG